MTVKRGKSSQGILGSFNLKVIEIVAKWFLSNYQFPYQTKIFYGLYINDVSIFSVLFLYPVPFFVRGNFSIWACKVREIG